MVGEQELVIEERYCGPSDSGNGGYVCGLVAGILGRAAEVTLRRPPPIGRTLLVRQSDAGGVALLDSAEVVATGLPARVEVEVPEAVGLRDAVEARPTIPWLRPASLPEVLRLWTGAGRGRRPPHLSRSGGWSPGSRGAIRPEFLWAALDCPGGFANGFPETTMVLGRLAMQLVRPIEPGTESVVVGWSEAVEGRKHFAGTAMFAADRGLPRCRSGDLDQDHPFPLVARRPHRPSVPEVVRVIENRPCPRVRRSMLGSGTSITR